MQNSPDDLRSFPETRWSLVARAAGASLESKRRALGELVRQYRPAFMKFLVVTKRIDPDVAEDIVQGFLATKVLGRDLIAKAETSKGRLRSFLRKSLQNYTVDRLRARRSCAVPLEEHLDAAVTQEAADAFDRAWAREVMKEVYRRMHVRLEATGRARAWRVFEDRVLRPARQDIAPTPSSDLAKQLGFASAKQVDNAFVTARRMLERQLRAVIGEYVPPEETDAEIAELMRIISQVW